jgi:hypothetical protein
MRTRTLLLLATILTVWPVLTAGLAAGGAGGAPPPGSAVRRVAAPLATAVSAFRVLRTWDHRRATAWSHADPAALADLYTARSHTGARDVSELRRWRDRGLRVVGLRQQVAEIRVRDATGHRLVLRVTERTVDGVAADGHRRTALPASAWMTHRIRLRRTGGRWRVDEVVVAQPAR